MEYLPDEFEMKEIDRITIEEIGIPSMVLMERAALAVASEVKRLWKAASRILCVCGCGNNGADGVAAARILSEWGYHVEIWIPVSSSHPSLEWKTQINIAEKLGISRVESPSLSEYTVIIDALFGVGLSRPIEGGYRDAVQKIQNSGVPVVAVDIPSGILAGNGMVSATAVRADVTVTFGMKKLGLLLYPGAEYAGTIRVADIGFPKSVVDRIAIKGYTYGIEDCGRMPKRCAYSNKGTYGKLLVAGGQKNMCGAVYFAASAAYQMGAGLVRIFTCEENRTILQEKIPQAVLTTFQTEEEMHKQMKEALMWAEALVIGPGFGTEAYAKWMVEEAIRFSFSHPSFPIVWDADALNLLARREEKGSFAYSIFTPHLGEMSRLMKKDISWIRENLIDAAKSYARKTGGICVLKDARTIVSDGGESYYVNSSGNHGMAVGGSGDVLAGMIGALLLAGISAKEAAQLGVYLHGISGDRAAAEKSAYSMGPETMLACISTVLREWVSENSN